MRDGGAVGRKFQAKKQDAEGPMIQKESTRPILTVRWPRRLNIERVSAKERHAVEIMSLKHGQ